MEQQPENKEANSEEATTFAVIEDPIQQESVSELLGPTQSENVELEGGGAAGSAEFGQEKVEAMETAPELDKVQEEVSVAEGAQEKEQGAMPPKDDKPASLPSGSEIAAASDNPPEGAGNKAVSSGHDVKPEDANVKPEVDQPASKKARTSPKKPKKR